MGELLRRSFGGQVVTGRREAAAFTRLDWVRAGFVAELGIDPYPGTLNLIADTAADRDGWTTLRSTPGRPLDPPPASGFCRGWCYAVRVNDAVPGAVVVPEVPAYPPDQIEIVAAIPLRETLALTDGDRVIVEPAGALPVSAIIFDVDGTLVDSLTAFRVVAEEAIRSAESLALPEVVITDAIVREALNTNQAFWDLALPADYTDREATMKALSDAAAARWPDVLREHGRVFPDAAPVLDRLRATGARLAIMTGARRGSLQPIADAGLLDRFDAVVCGEDVSRRKPDPDGLLACLERLRVDAGRAVYVGDTPLDVRAAHAAGVFAVGVLTGAGDSALLSASGADRLTATLAGLPRICESS